MLKASQGIAHEIFLMFQIPLRLQRSKQRGFDHKATLLCNCVNYTTGVSHDLILCVFFSSFYYCFCTKIRKFVRSTTPPCFEPPCQRLKAPSDACLQNLSKHFDDLLVPGSPRGFILPISIQFHHLSSISSYQPLDLFS